MPSKEFSKRYPDFEENMDIVSHEIKVNRRQTRLLITAGIVLVVGVAYAIAKQTDPEPDYSDLAKWVTSDHKEIGSQPTIHYDPVTGEYSYTEVPEKGIDGEYQVKSMHP